MSDDVGLGLLRVWLFCAGFFFPPLWILLYGLSPTQSGWVADCAATKPTRFGGHYVSNAR
jgi:hypothetical protein